MKNIFNMLNNNQANNYSTIQNCRADIFGELEAIIQYNAHLQQTDNEKAKETIEDIMHEEMLHVGQLFGLLFYLNPESKSHFEKGLNEFNNSI